VFHVLCLMLVFGHVSVFFFGFGLFVFHVLCLMLVFGHVSVFVFVVLVFLFFVFLVFDLWSWVSVSKTQYQYQQLHGERQGETGAGKTRHDRTGKAEQRKMAQDHLRQQDPKTIGDTTTKQLLVMCCIVLCFLALFRLFLCSLVLSCLAVRCSLLLLSCAVLSYVVCA
jgi:hypothetical protein